MRLKIHNKVLAALSAYTTADASSLHCPPSAVLPHCAAWEQPSSGKGCQKNGEKNRQDQFCEKLLKVFHKYKGWVCICGLCFTQIHTHICQKFCPTKPQFKVVVNFGGDRGETTEAGNSPFGFADEGYRRRSNSSFCSITT